MDWIKTYYGVIGRWFSRNLWTGYFLLGKAELGRKEVLGGRYYDSTRLKRGLFLRVKYFTVQIYVCRNCGLAVVQEGLLMEGLYGTVSGSRVWLRFKLILLQTAIKID